ncbi:MAG: SpoIIE family protein phosphatase [Clostridia bacterium]|nr:SpoIIE family protein phosphatase [Clostridia bacterium]
MDKKIEGEKRWRVAQMTDSFVAGLRRLRRKEEENRGKSCLRLRGAMKRSALPVSLFALSFAASCSSPALGVLPIGPALVCAAPSLVSVVAVTLGALGASFRIASDSPYFALVILSLFCVRLSEALFVPGKAGCAKGEIGKIFGKSPQVPSLIKLNAAFNVSPGRRVVTAMIASLVLGSVNTFTGTNFWYDVFGTVLGLVLTPLLCFAFSSLFDRDSNPTLRKAGAGAVVYAVILSLSKVAFGGMKIGAAAAFLVSLTAGYSLGITDGALIGLFAGIALEPSLAAAYPLAAMCMGAVSSFSVGAASVASALLSLSFALFSEGISAISSAMPEIALSSALFYPAARLELVKRETRLFVPEAKSVGIAMNDRCVSERLLSVASAMEKMSKVFSNLSKRLRFPGRGETVSICSDAFFSSCELCEKRDICHVREGFVDGGVIRGAAEYLSENGRLTRDALPASLMRGCPAVDRIIESVNGEYRLLVESAVKGDKTAAIASDYLNVSRLINETVGDAEKESERNKELSDKLSAALSEWDITFESLAVYGVRRPQVYVRGFTAKDLTCGACDLRKIAEEAVGVPLTEPEMSIEYDRLNMFAECRKRFAAQYGVYCEASVRCGISGDVSSSFKSRSGDFYLLICDGMGSGREASLTAKVSALFLERMISAGSTEETALRMLNDFTRERRIECSSTVDLLKLDVYTGEATFFKSGGAPSFVLRDGRLFKIECDTMPVGILDKMIAKSVKFDLLPGDVVVMMSDGILPDPDDAMWLFDHLLEKTDISEDLPEAAKRLTKKSRERVARKDDATVGIIKIKEVS